MLWWHSVPSLPRPGTENKTAVDRVTTPLIATLLKTTSVAAPVVDHPMSVVVPVPLIVDHPMSVAAPALLITTLPTNVAALVIALILLMRVHIGAPVATLGVIGMGTVPALLIMDPPTIATAPALLTMDPPTIAAALALLIVAPPMSVAAPATTPHITLLIVMGTLGSPDFNFLRSAPEVLECLWSKGANKLLGLCMCFSCSVCG